MLCASQSMRCQAAYVYSAAGPGESTTDLAWDGQATIHELGALLAQTERFPVEEPDGGRRRRRRAPAARAHAHADVQQRGGRRRPSGDGVPAHRVRARAAPSTTSGFERAHRPLSVRARRSRRGSTATATRRSTSRCRA